MALLLTETQVQDVRDRIRTVAERQFAARGLVATSLRSIAAELGWAPASLYRYFRNKDELVATTRAAAHDRFSQRIETAYAQPGNLWDRSRALGEAYVDFAFEEPAAYQLIFALEQADGCKPAELRAAEERSRRTLTGYLEDMVAAGLLEGDPALLGHVYWSAIHGLIVLQMAGKLKPSLPFDTIRHEITRLLTRGALPAPR
ncbi:TetR/AcrR family transcriptional regulator [Sphingomonas paeninsulae]|jgi:AcrR family transcriptional regulator|uniref:TetR/AcrR family transcriptional regulator n=1 Tax=Sphingomonas paeninsulae TaxID=2319844 RepID=UPI0013CE458A|nr:TetR/AcrR family transcriptional regulator [Sphingomonas paeninsulae]